MKIEPSHINQIKASFEKMQTKEDLLQLLNQVKPLIYGEKTIPFDLKQLTWYANPKLSLKRYTEFKIKKKSGSERSIHAPVKGLKALQKTLSLILQCIFQPHQAAMGFVPGKSIVDNAKLHAGSKYVYNIDLKDFFPSVDQARVWKCLQLRPFNLKNDTKDSKRFQLANILAAICCTEMEVERKSVNSEWELVKRNVLPQGAPTSPVITNIVCQRLDYILTGVAKRFKLNYSRYADDITFSAMYDVFKGEGDFQKELQRIITEQGFHIKESKTRLQKDGYRKEVTGLLVNENVNVQQRYIKQLRMWLYYWERYGETRAYNFFLQQYLADKGHIVKGKPSMVNVIRGKLDYLKMVKGGDNELYLKLRGRFDELIERTADQEKTKKIISTIEKEAKSKESTKIKSNNLYPILHSPLKTVELLKFFTANEKDLKYSTHSWEEGKYEGYDDYIKKIKTEWDNIYDLNTNQKFYDILKKQSTRLYAKISNFLFNEKLGQKNEKGYYNVWGEKRLKFGWMSHELKIHMEDLGNSPFSCPIPAHIRELDSKYNLLYFKDYADVFKNEIEFREDSNNFKKMILDLWESELSYDFEIKGIGNLVGFSFFTDVNYVKDSLRILLRDLFKTKPEFSQIIIEKISHFEKGGFHIIKITQKDSFVTRDVKDPKFENPTGNLYSIINNLKNLADYSIVSRFADGKNYRINYLTSLETKFVENITPDEEVLGFTHEFKFYL